MILLQTFLTYFKGVLMNYSQFPPTSPIILRQNFVGVFLMHSYFYFFIFFDLKKIFFAIFFTLFFTIVVCFIFKVMRYL